MKVLDNGQSRYESHEFLDASMEIVEIKLKSGKNIRVIVENDKDIRIIADHRIKVKNYPKTESDFKALKLCPKRIGLDNFYND
jgi:hypothetical protein